MHRVLKIGQWVVDFMFCPERYDISAVVAVLRELSATSAIIEQAIDLMESGDENTGFTYTHDGRKRGLVVIGPSSSGSEFLDTFSHEIYHVASAVAESLGKRLDGEGPAYIAGDTARDLLDVVCQLGCKHCHK